MHPTPLLAVSAALALGAPLSAQTFADTNWSNLHDGTAEALLGPSFFSGTVGQPTVGAAIRHCYSIDRAQGGRSEDGSTAITWCYVTQGYGGANPLQGVSIGPMTFSSQVSDSLSDDSCFSAFFTTAGTLYQSQPSVLVPGFIAGTGGLSVNQGLVWSVAFQFLTPIEVPNRLGTDPLASTGSNHVPLLAHLIYEVQGPLNFATTNKQYWTLSTDERSSTTPGAPGGVANGNSLFGTFLFGVPPEQSGATSHTRAFATASGFATGSTFGPQSEWISGLAFDQPVLQGINGAHAGAGGADWHVSAEPIDQADLRLLDRLSAQQTDPTAPLYNAGITLNIGYALTSCTAATTMLQQPFSWDDQGGTVAPTVGTSTVGVLQTLRQGPQKLHVNVDACTQAFLGVDIGLFKSFNRAPGAFGTVFDFATEPSTAGGARLDGGPYKVVSSPVPALSGTRVGFHAVVLQTDAALPFAAYIAETSTTLEVLLH